MKRPDYKEGDVVRFKLLYKHPSDDEYQDLILEGTVEIVDAYGTFGQNEEPSYDILIQDPRVCDGSLTLVKHIRESSLLR